ncbi:MAG: hypothetical protein V1899_01120 [Planctomycetota bacterium]
MISVNVALFYLILHSALTSDEQNSIELWLTGITILMVALVAGLVTLALIIRRITKRFTRPCRWCMEFIPKKAIVCPRCGKSVVVHHENMKQG